MNLVLRSALLGFITLVALNVACADDSSPPDQGRVTLVNDQGIDFASGAVADPGNYANSDIYATNNGDAGMKLTTGGANPAANRPITWFRSGGGIPATFDDLASVPSAPPPTTYDALVHAKQNNGFLLRAENGDLVRGWLEAADASSVTVQWERILPE